MNGVETDGLEDRHSPEPREGGRVPEAEADDRQARRSSGWAGPAEGVGGPGAAGWAGLGQLARSRPVPEGPKQNFAQARIAIPNFNRGFQLLKKAGWTEGKGLGAQEQGTVTPVPAHVKKTKRGIGSGPEEAWRGPKHRGDPGLARKKGDPGLPRKKPRTGEQVESEDETASEDSSGDGEERLLSAKQRRQQHKKEKAREAAIAQMVYRAFLPDNV